VHDALLYSGGGVYDALLYSGGGVYDALLYCGSGVPTCYSAAEAATGTSDDVVHQCACRPAASSVE
jgi:hypothetical protein